MKFIFPCLHLHNSDLDVTQRWTPTFSNKKIESNRLCLARVTLNSRETDKPVALKFQVELAFGNVSLLRREQG